jgi:FlaA1/EpsC-like NDP-sugar epimerase
MRLGISLVAALRRRRGVVLLGVDALLIAGAYAVVTVLRYDESPAPWAGVAIVAAVAIAATTALGWSAKLYGGRARVASVEETLLLGSVVVSASVVMSVLNVVVFDHAIARSIPLGAGLMAATAMVLARAMWRDLANKVGRRRPADAVRTLVVGAGDAGTQLVRSMLGTPSSPYWPVGLVDDDPWKRNLRVAGVPVLGTSTDLESVVRQHDIGTVVVAIPSASSRLIDAFAERVAALEVEVKVLPPVTGLFDRGRISIRDVRDIDNTDVLGRNVIETDVGAIADFLSGKRVLVTGAGGSIGSELSRQIAQWEPAELMLLDRDESALHGVQLMIHGHGLLDTDETILADIRELETLQRIFEERRPEVVFHAAALKHLPMLERYPSEGVKTNVVGTLNVLKAASAVGVERFVNISTDKAADPTSVLGMTKRAAERLTASFAEEDEGVYLSVRFGNVLGSRGSVLTAWAEQIANGGPVTVTDPEVTRYFMTIPEACQLVIQAGAIGADGEALILDMGEPVRLDDVARKLIRQSGKKIEIIYTGLRDGEKMHEALISDEEADHRPHHDLITHVTVPPMPAAEVREDAPDVRERLRVWCADGGDSEATNGRLGPENPEPMGVR